MHDGGQRIGEIALFQRGLEADVFYAVLWALIVWRRRLINHYALDPLAPTPYPIDRPGIVLSFVIVASLL